MKKSKTRYMLLLIVLPFTIKVNGQACGGGILTFNIYTINGSKVKDFRYEIWPVTKKILEEDFKKEMEAKNVMEDLNWTGMLISKTRRKK